MSEDRYRKLVREQAEANSAELGRLLKAAYIAQGWRPVVHIDERDAATYGAARFRLVTHLDNGGVGYFFPTGGTWLTLREIRIVLEALTLCDPEMNSQPAVREAYRVGGER